MSLAFDLASLRPEPILKMSRSEIPWALNARLFRQVLIKLSIVLHPFMHVSKPAHHAETFYCRRRMRLSARQTRAGSGRVPESAVSG